MEKHKISLFVLLLAGMVSVASAGTIDLANSSWNAGTATIEVDGLAVGQKIVITIYDDATCNIKASVRTAGADGAGTVVAAIPAPAGDPFAVGDSVVVSDPDCATLDAPNDLVDDPTCPTCGVTGACCSGQGTAGGPFCVDGVAQGACEALADFYAFHAGQTCAQVNNCIPAVSTWGVVAMTILVLSAATVVLRRRLAMAA